MRVTEPARVGSSLSTAKDALTDMPPREESELDPVTLHNQVRHSVHHHDHDDDNDNDNNDCVYCVCALGSGVCRGRSIRRV